MNKYSRYYELLNVCVQAYPYFEKWAKDSGLSIDKNTLIKFGLNKVLADLMSSQEGLTLITDAMESIGMLDKPEEFRELLKGDVELNIK